MQKWHTAEICKDEKKSYNIKSRNFQKQESREIIHVNNPLQGDASQTNIKSKLLGEIKSKLRNWNSHPEHSL